MMQDVVALPCGLMAPASAHAETHISGNHGINTALDLYSGIGGWGLGLGMAGIHVIQSYERAIAACETQIKNQAGQVVQCDIRKEIPGLPSRVDLVVGSP